MKAQGAPSRHTHRAHVHAYSTRFRRAYLGPVLGHPRHLSRGPTYHRARARTPFAVVHHHPVVRLYSTVDSFSAHRPSKWCKTNQRELLCFSPRSFPHVALRTLSSFVSPQGLLTLLKGLKRDNEEKRILMLGLDNSGKTTALKKLAGVRCTPRGCSVSLHMRLHDRRMFLSTATLARMCARSLSF